LVDDEDIGVKFYKQIDYNRRNAKLGQTVIKWSRDLIFEFWDPTPFLGKD